MSVRIRLEAADVTDLDAHEAALRTVLSIGEPGSREYRNRRRGDEGELASRRYLTSAGVRATAAAPVDELSPLAQAEYSKPGRDLLGEITTLRAADADLQRRPWVPLQPGDVVLMHLGADAHSPAYGQTFLAVDHDTDIAGNAMLREVSRTPNPWDDPAAGEPQYLLRCDTVTGRWGIYALTTEDLEHWIDAPAGVDDEDLARRWAVEEITGAEDGREVTGWREIDGRGCAPVFSSTEQHPDPGEALTRFYELWFEAGPDALTVIRAGAVVHGRPATSAPKGA